MKPTHRPFIILVATATFGLALHACNGAAPTGANPATAGGAPSMATVPGIAQGTAVDAKGKPLADVTVDIRGTVTENGRGVSHEAKTDAAGKWRYDALAPGAYKLTAWRQVTSPLCAPSNPPSVTLRATGSSSERMRPSSTASPASMPR